MLRTVRDALLALLVASLLMSLIGLLLNDRLRLLAPMMYLPAAPIAAAALLCDLLYRGHVLRGPRFQLTILSIVALALSATSLFGLRRFDDPSSDPSIRILQWNLMWGGNWSNPYRWEEISSKIIGRKPDVIVLAESPATEDAIRSLCMALGEDWTLVRHDYVDAKSGYFARGRVLSRYPLELEHTEIIPNGALAVVSVSAPRPVRLLVVEAISGLGDKTPMLDAVSDAVSRFAPIDIICGDFNAVGRSHGFAGIRSQGFDEANNRDLTWRGTWPTSMPLYDLDHLLVAERHRVLNSRSFMSDASDHRGQFADLVIVPSDGK